ncbi:MAG: hypothetical protein B6I36_05280 [Desulfobacteraceae bacterium 4572_35.1]|nr:MAG: hypothetical protein B6I36_05280 [Desulfobacteraceae bacterium 4572_35.1]
MPSLIITTTTTAVFRSRPFTILLLAIYQLLELNLKLFFMNIFVCFGVVAGTVTYAWCTDFSTKVQQPLHQTLQVQQQSQKQADKWDVQRRKMVAELESLQQQQQQLTTKKNRLEDKNNTYRKNIVELKRAIDESKRLTAEMKPFLDQTLELLQSQVEQDIPFLKQERQQRLQHLKVALADEKLSMGEKFRRLMEALRVEIEYGRNIEVIQHTIAIDGRDILMNQLRLGRLALFAQSLDGKHSLIYEMATQSWQSVASKYNHEIGLAMEMGLKHRPVDLLTLPIGRVSGDSLAGGAVTR